MTVSLYMAVSLDGRTCREDGSEDFLSPYNWERLVSLAETHGALLVGRRTYEAVKEWDNHSYLNIDADRYVLTSQEIEEEGYKVVRDPSDVANRTDDLLVTGGAEANSAFFDSGLVDRVYLNIEPTLIGDGNGIVSEIECDVQLSFVRMSRNDSIIEMEYSVE